MRIRTTLFALLFSLALPASVLAQDDFDLEETPDPLSPTTEDPLAPDPLATDPITPETTEGGEVTESGTATGPAAGSLGVGVTGLLVGAVAGEALYWVNDQLAIDVALGFSVRSQDMADTATTFVLSAGALYKLFQKGRASLQIGGRLDLGIASQAETATGFAVEIPVRAEVALTDRIALHGETGVVLDFVPDDGAVFAPATPGATRIAIGGQLLTSFGLTAYF